MAQPRGAEPICARSLVRWPVRGGAISAPWWAFLRRTHGLRIGPYGRDRLVSEALPEVIAGIARSSPSDWSSFWGMSHFSPAIPAAAI